MKQKAVMRTLKLAGATRRASIVVAIIATFATNAMLPALASAKSKTTSVKLSGDQKILHLLNRIGYGARVGDLERVRALGIDKFIDQQLHPERIDDAAAEARLKGLDSLNMSVAEIHEKYPQPNLVARQLGLRGGPNQQANPNNPNQQPDNQSSQQEQRQYRQQIFAHYQKNGLKLPQALLQELMAQKILRARYSERQLQEVMADFWFNHFNIDWRKGADKWLVTDYEMNAIRPNTLGKFKDIVLATAKSPAMLFYLDNFQSMSPDTELPRRGMGRRSRLQRGQPGNAGVDPQMNTGQMPANPQVQQLRNRQRGINENYARELMELHTLGVDGGYTQKDVQEVARAFTGWTIDQPRRNGAFIFRPRMHDDGEKTVLGQKIPAGGGMSDGERVIEILTRHPNTAKFISTKLVRRLVSDEAPASLVKRVTDVYLKTDGDIREMLKTILKSNEFYSKEAYRAKIKSPFELAVSAVRALNGEITNTTQLAQFIAKMGQPLYQYQPPTGYPDRAEQWVNTGALLERLNFSLALSANRVRGSRVDLKRAAPDIDRENEKAALDKAITLLLNNEVSPQTRQVLDKQLKEGVPVKGELGNTQAATAGSDAMDSGDAMVAGSPAQNRRGGNAGRGRRAQLAGLNNGGLVEQAQLSPAEAETAKVFGLVLGSPEFQRK
jgi:uncharacterized protein (DUF1800 family)